jgi:hypothetical protein
VVNPVDLASDEDADLAVIPLLLVGEQIGDEQGEAWQSHEKESFTISLWGHAVVCSC